MLIKQFCLLWNTVSLLYWPHFNEHKSSRLKISGINRSKSPPETLHIWHGHSQSLLRHNTIIKIMSIIWTYVLMKAVLAQNRTQHPKEEGEMHNGFFILSCALWGLPLSMDIHSNSFSKIRIILGAPERSHSSCTSNIVTGQLTFSLNSHLISPQETWKANVMEFTNCWAVFTGITGSDLKWLQNNGCVPDRR